MRLFLMLIAVLTLSACAGIPASTHSTGPSLPYSASDDTLTANWVANSESSFQLRLARLDQYPHTVQQLVESCRQGLFVELIVPQTQRRAAAVLRGSCVHVWLSDYPDMARSSTVALMDQDTLIEGGYIRKMRDASVRKEYTIQQYLKTSAVPLN